MIILYRLGRRRMTSHILDVFDNFMTWNTPSSLKLISDIGKVTKEVHKNIRNLLSPNATVI